MKKYFLLFLLTTNFIYASYSIIEKENIFTVKLKDYDFNTLYLNLKNEINFESFIIVHELNLAKSTENIFQSLGKKNILKNGINILLCKTSFTAQMHQENIENITYCPMIISIYEDNNFCYISYKKYKTFKDTDMIANKINEKLKNLILNSLE